MLLTGTRIVAKGPQNGLLKLRGRTFGFPVLDHIKPGQLLTGKKPPLEIYDVHEGHQPAREGNSAQKV